MTIQEMINNTNERINNWYKNANADYGVVGNGSAHYNKEQNKVVVEYVENGAQNTWEMAFYPEYMENGLNWVFNCWSELA